MGRVITAGCGISYAKFDKWPTWPRFCVLSHELEHVNVGGPASGNEHIARSVCRAIREQTPDCVIVTWTSFDKLDLYVEDATRIADIKNYPSRNFLIDYLGRPADSAGWWPSSVSKDNPIKQAYQNYLESQTYYYIRTLESILSVQSLCKQKQIPCYMFLGYEFDFDQLQTHSELSYLYHAIDWSCFVCLDNLDAQYQQSHWFKYSTTKQHGLMPVAGWHWEFYNTHIVPILDQYFEKRNTDKFIALEKEIEKITVDCFEKGLS